MLIAQAHTIMAEISLTAHSQKRINTFFGAAILQCFHIMKTFHLQFNNSINFCYHHLILVCAVLKMHLHSHCDFAIAQSQLT